MKRVIALTLAVMLIAALLCACGDKNITTTVNPAYDDGFAAKYATGTSTDDNGNNVYEFTADNYATYTREHNSSLSTDMEQYVIAQHDETFGEYIYINEEKKAVYVGIHADEYDAASAQKEADNLADYGWKYFQSIENPVSEISVIYCNAGDQTEEYGRFDYTLSE